MSEAPDTRPEPVKPPSGKRASRDDRLKVALKANMARRKAQAKARAADPTGQGDDRQQDNE